MHALHRNWSEVEQLYRTSAGSDGSQGAWTALTRLALWRRGEIDLVATMERLVREMPEGTVPNAVLSVVRDNRLPPAWHEFLATRLGPAASARSRIFFSQLEAEIHAYLGEDECVFAPLDQAVDMGLIDLAWLEGCPLFDGAVRADPRFRAALARLRDRVARILAAYRSTER
jgi:hypothetical protein